MKRSIMSLLLILVPMLYLTAQSNDVIDKVLAEDSINLSEALYFCLVSNGAIDEAADLQAAFQKGKELGLDMGQGPDYILNIGELSFLIGKTFQIPGGLMYTLFPGPRYSLRELIARKIINGKPDGLSKVKGNELIRYIGKAARFKAGEQ